MKDFTTTVNEINKVLSKITNSFKVVPSKKELRDHAVLMEEQTMGVPEINTGLTMAMEECKVSESSGFNCRQ